MDLEWNIFFRKKFFLKIFPPPATKILIHNLGKYLSYDCRYLDGQLTINHKMVNFTFLYVRFFCVCLVCID